MVQHLFGTDFTCVLPKRGGAYRSTAGILQTDAAGIGWERQYGAQLQKVRSKSTEHDQRRFAPLWGEPALFFRAPLPSMKKTERQSASDFGKESGRFAVLWNEREFPA